MVKYTVKVGGALLIVMGVMTVTGWMNGVTSYLSSFGGAPAAQEQPADQGADEAKGDGANGGSSDASDAGKDAGSGDGAASKADAQAAPLADLKLVDQNGEEHSLDEYRGKTVFLELLGHLVRAVPARDPRHREAVPGSWRERGRPRGAGAWRILKPTAVPTTATCPKPT